MTEVDEFAKPGAVDAANAPPVEVKLKTRGVIVSSMFEAGNAKTDVEKNTILHMDYGDLEPKDRVMRRETEAVWTVGKKNVNQFWLPALPKDANFIMVGTNATACYAMAIHSDEHKELLSEMECESLARNLRHGINHLSFRTQAVETLSNLNAIAKNDESLRAAIKNVGKSLTEKLHSLPESPPVGAAIPPVVTAKRPGGEFPQVECIMYNYVPDEEVVVDAAESPSPPFDSYYLWTVPTVEPGGKWRRNDKTEFRVRPNSVPVMAVNQTHFVILYQQHNLTDEDIISIDVYGLTSIGRVQQTRIDRFHFSFPEQFSASGILSMTLSDQGVCSVAYSTGCLVIDVLRQVERPRVFVLSTPDQKNRRIVTTARVHHLPAPEGSRPELSDDWDANITPGDTPLLERNLPPVPAWSGTLVIGTTAGEAFGLCWRSGALVFVEIIPGVEPVFSCLYSNRRVLIHSVMGISGKLLPYISEQMTYLPTSRPLGMAICGTLLFVMEKYGSLQVYSTSARAVLFPFKPPKLEFKSTVPQYAYQAIHATPTRVTALYPNGLVRVLQIRKREKGVASNKPRKTKKK